MIAYAAAAVVAIGTVSVLGTPVISRWSAPSKRTPIGGVEAAPWPDLGPSPEHSAALRVRPREGQASALVGSGTPARPPAPEATATAATVRPARNRGRAPAASPTRTSDPVARREPMEPLAATPLASADTPAAASPPTAATPAVEAVVPTNALEATKVDVRPAIVRRTDARAAAAPAGTPEMVVLRVLVSATGTPATVHVLRGSKVDRAVDGAAVAAVKQWAFSPALKRGRPVDCWFNVAVPVEGEAQ